MLKNILLLTLFASFNTVLAQNNSIKPISISGEITGTTMASDSIHFRTGPIHEKYFERIIPSARIIDNKFQVKAELSYPQMYGFVFGSDKNKITYRSVPFYIDNSTSSINIDYVSSQCSQLTGSTFEEYQQKFIPFMLANKGEYDCKTSELVILRQNKAPEFDARLIEYVKQNPDSYVALWNLIYRFSVYGHSAIREKTLTHFSENIKNEKLWPIINNDLVNAGIKENHRFPVFTIKTPELKEQKLNLPKAQYTLVDFWFSRCRPCIESFPKLKELYATYKAKGFEIISITTDRTKDVPLWQSRIKEYELPWPQYLDENETEAAKLIVHNYPATFLLNQKGELIRKDISPEQLEEFLKEHL